MGKKKSTEVKNTQPAEVVKPAVYDPVADGKATAAINVEKERAANEGLKQSEDKGQTE